MKLVYTDRTMLMVAHIRNLLEAEGIACDIRNEYLASGAGELPPTECWPEVWVNDREAERARTIIADAMREGDQDLGESWHCPVCGEEVDGNFWQCWKCGANRLE